jgi:hypothetical protein
LIFGVALAIGYHRHGFKGGSPLPVWVWPTIVFDVAFAIAYVIPWISSLTVAQIAVSQSGVYRTSRESAVLVFQHWPWDAIADCRIDRAPFAPSAYDGLCLNLHSGETIFIGLNEKVDLDRLREVLRSLGKLAAARI